MNTPRFQIRTTTVPTYERFTLEVALADELPPNPFVDARLCATVTTPGGRTFDVDGFCDSTDGSRYLLRVMPKEPGTYTVAARLMVAALRDSLPAGKPVPTGEPPVMTEYETAFEATASDHPGMLELDPEFPEHFRHAQSGEHYFWNGTTAYYLMGWQDESVIERSLARLAAKRVNRARVLLYGREYDRPWRQPVVQTDAFKLVLNPWPARYPDDRTNPEFDLSRFDVGFWQKFERMLEAADRHGVQISVCFFIGGQQLAVPFAMWSEDEMRYYRYAIARLAAYPNVTWDIGNEHDFHRDNQFWANAIGIEFSQRDPYGHLCGIHNKPYYAAWGTWLTLQLHQTWDAGLADELADRRAKQAAGGRVVPQIIEEYGYEDLWEVFPGQRSAESRRRVCWEVAMAGGYQTNGETARTGAGERLDTGGGWVTGRGDDSMTMFDTIAHMVDFFTSFSWWRARPDADALLAYEPGRSAGVEYYYRDGRPATDRPPQVLSAAPRAGDAESAENAGGLVGADGSSAHAGFYVVYLPYGGRVRLRLAGDRTRSSAGDELTDGDWNRSYEVTRFDPRTGARAPVADASPGDWIAPWSDGPADLVYLLRTRDR